mgnify:CR=1 FL=1
MDKIVCTGAKEIELALAELEKRIANKIIRRVMRESMKPIAVAARENAPVETGVLRSAIKVRAMKRSRGRIGIMVMIGEGDFKGDTYYGGFQEYGWKTGKRSDPDNQRREVEGKGYMRKAWDGGKETAKQQAERLLLDAIEAEVKSLGGKLAP